MERENRARNDLIILIILFIVAGSLFLYNKHDIFMSAEADGYFHALGGFFVYDFAKWWINSPTFSLNLMKSFVIDYQVHYKFFGGISYYQPFQSLFAGFLAFFSGKQPLTFYIATSLETIGTMLFAYRIYGLLYGNRKRLFRFLVPVLIAFSPAVFNFGASYSLEPGVMLFATMTMHYFIRFMKTERKGDIYKTAASAGLGVLTKSTFLIILPMLLLSLFLEGKHQLIFRNYKAVAISFLIFLAVISPWLASEYAYSTLGISKAGERLEAAAPGIELMIGKRLTNATTTVWVVFGTLLLVPFFIYKLFRSRLAAGEIALLTFIILYALFYNMLDNALIPYGIQPRYLTAAVPFAVVLSVRGMQLFFERQKKYAKYAVPLIGIIVFTSALSCYNYTTLQKNDLGATDVVAPAIYIMDNTQSPITVMSTFSRMQAVAFQVIEDRNISVVEAPYRHSGGENETMLMLDSRDYVRRLHKPEWEKFNMTHPPIGWVIVHEKYDGWAEPDYCLKCIIDQRDDFELVQVMEGKWPGNRVFIYKRNPSFFY